MSENNINVYGEFFYKRSSDDNDANDPKVVLVYKNTVPFIHIYKTMKNIRDIGNNDLLESYSSTTIIYDPKYEDDNNEKRFKILGSYKYYNGDSVVWLYDKATSNIFAAKFMDTLDPKTNKNKKFHFIIYPVASPKFSIGQNSNLLFSKDNELAKLVFKNNNQSINDVSLVIKGDFGNRTALNVRADVNDNLRPATEMNINNFLELSVNDIDLDKTSFYTSSLFQYDHMQDSFIVTELSSDMDYIYLPLDL